MVIKDWIFLIGFEIELGCLTRLFFVFRLTMLSLKGMLLVVLICITLIFS